MSQLKIIALGSLDLFEANVKHLALNGYKPDLLIHPSDRDNSNLKKGLRSLQIETWETGDITSLAPRLREFAPDLMISLAFPEIYKKQIIDIPRIGMFNLHCSHLPKGRGRHHLNWALIEGDLSVGVTTHLIDEKIDEGDIILQDLVVVERDDDYASLSGRLLEKSKEVVLATVRQMEAGIYYRKKQDPRLASYQRKRVPEDSLINWNSTSKELGQFINALVDPMPNAYTFLNKETVKFKKAYRGKVVGEVLAKTEDGRYVISTKDSVVLVATDAKLQLGQVLDVDCR